MLYQFLEEPVARGSSIMPSSICIIHIFIYYNYAACMHWMDALTCACARALVHAHVHTHTCKHIHMYTHKHACTYLHTCTQAQTHTSHLGSNNSISSIEIIIVHMHRATFASDITILPPCKMNLMINC